MTVYTTTANKDDGRSHDACPTCGAHARIKATTDASGHSYRLTCRQCPWSVPLSEPQPTATRDDGLLIADGGTTTENATDGGPQSAQDILDELYREDAVARVADKIRAGDGNPSAADIHQTLGLAEDRLCFVFEHDCGTEYVWLADGWQHFEARLVRDRDGETIDARLLPGDLDHRVEKLSDAELVGSTPVSRPELSEADSQ